MAAQVRAKHAVDFVVGTRQDGRVLEQRIEREREQPAGCLMAGDQERDALRDDVGIVQLLAGLSVDHGQHPVEQVVDGAHGAGCAPILDDVLHRPHHELLVGPKLPSPLAMQPALDGQFPRFCLCVFKGAQHGNHEGVWRFAVQGVESIVEAA